MNFKRRYFVSVLAILAVAVLTAHAEDFWVKKDWTKWSKDECNKMLTDSPWSKTWTKSQVNLSAALPSDTGGSNRSGGAGENAPELHYSVQFRSALPVRKAFARLSEIQAKYDSMDAEHRKAIDTQVQSILSKTYDDVILVHVEYGSINQIFERDMSTYWRNIRPDSIPEDFYLINERGDRIAPIKFLAPPAGTYAFELVFPRLKNNEPIVRNGDKNLELQFISPAVGSQSIDASGVAAFGRERVLSQYRVDKMTVDGKLTY
jgi:hypothetical protein